MVMNAPQRPLPCPECAYDLQGADLEHGRFARCPECGNTIDLRRATGNGFLRLWGMLFVAAFAMGPAVLICGTIWAAPEVMTKILEADSLALFFAFFSYLWPIIALAHPVISVVLTCLCMRGPTSVVVISALCMLFGAAVADGLTVVYFFVWMMTYFGGC